MTRHIPKVQTDEVYEANYTARKKIADEAADELAAAIFACGPDAERYGRYILHDKLGLEPERITYWCDRGAGREPPPPESDERVLADKVTFTTRGGIKYEGWSITVKGVKYYPFRWSNYVGTITEYKPRTPAQTKAAAEARRAKALAGVEAEAAAKRDAEARNPTLFAWAGLDLKDPR